MCKIVSLEVLCILPTEDENSHDFTLFNDDYAFVSYEYIPSSETSVKKLQSIIKVTLFLFVFCDFLIIVVISLQNNC